MITLSFLDWCIQLWLSITELDLLNDMYVESSDDSCNYTVLGTQEDMDCFYIVTVAFFCYNLVVGKGCCFKLEKEVF